MKGLGQPWFASPGASTSAMGHWLLNWAAFLPPASNQNKSFLNDLIHNLCSIPADPSQYISLPVTHTLVITELTQHACQALYFTFNFIITNSDFVPGFVVSIFHPTGVFHNFVDVYPIRHLSILVLSVLILVLQMSIRSQYYGRAQCCKISHTKKVDEVFWTREKEK